MLGMKVFTSGEWRANCYVVHDPQRDAIMIDPGEEIESAISYVREHELTMHAVVATHAHYDHVASAQRVKDAFAIPFFLHGADAKLLKQANFYRTIFGGKRPIPVPVVDVDLTGSDRLQFGALAIDILHTPGHTPGSVALLCKGHLFAGDTVLARRIGRTDLPGGDKALLATSVRRLFALAPTTLLCPGHGPSITLAESRTINREAAELVE